MSLSTHVLDLHSGQPAANIPVTLMRDDQKIGHAVTDSDGRISDLLGKGALESGQYQLNFDVADYFARQASETLYETIPVKFVIRDTSRHYHIPLLLSPFGYSTYRGS